MRVLRRAKDLLNGGLERLLKHRLEHVALLTDEEPLIYRHLADTGFRPRAIADIGAARGEWTRCMLPLFPDASYWMAEPLIENQAVLATVAAAAPAGRVHIWQGAIGRTCGTLRLFAHGDQSSSFASEWKGEVRDVPLQTLDALVTTKAWPQPDLIKMDVQGAEIEVLAGATQVIAAAQVVQMEVAFRRVYEQAPLAHEVIAEMARHGFRIYDLSNHYKRPGDRALLQMDLIFAREGAWFQPESWSI